MVQVAFTTSITALAVASDLVGRFISFLSQKCGRQHAATEAEDLERLRSVLLRIHTVVEEAEARQITNRGMVLQLKGLMESMYLGYYALDTFKFQPLEEDGAPDPEDNQVSHKRLRLCSSTSRRKNTSLLAFGTESTAMVKRVLRSLETKISDVREFIMLLPCCPRLPQKLYSTYLFMDKIMFGRNVEKEKVISFLLHDDQNLAVLPIVGPRMIGKKTLVHHACQDERVRGRFPHIVFVHGDDLILGARSLVPSRKYLCIVQFSWDADVQAWETFQSSLRNAATSGSKVVIIGRTDEIARWGTAPPIRLTSLSQEEYWYYFKALAFGTMNPDEHPKLASLGMQLAKQLQGSFLGANMVGNVLQANPDAEIWYEMLMSLREMEQMRFLLFGEQCPDDILAKNDPVDTAMMVSLRYRGCLAYDLRETGHAQIRELPRLTPEGPQMEDGKNIPRDEKFDIVVWRSRILPFRNYIATFVKPKPRRVRRRKNHLPTRDSKIRTLFEKHTFPLLENPL